MWMKPGDYSGSLTSERQLNESARSEIKANQKWCGLGIIKYPDGSMF